MKKIIIASLFLGMGTVFTGNLVHAYKEVPDPAPLTFAHKMSLREKLSKAIQLRYEKLRNQYQRDLGEKNIINQRMEHRQSKNESHVNESATTMKRTGPLEAPEYNKRKPATGGNYVRPNAKQTFRARAIDYYVDGGVAGKEAMESGVVRSSEHRVNMRPNYWLRNAFIGNIVTPIRDVQRQLVPPKAESVVKPSTPKTGSWTRNYMHPYMGNDWMEYKEGSGFFSTESEEK